MKPLVVDCHLHTRRYSGCSALGPERACQLACERGLDAVVITEHRRRWSDLELAPLRRAFPRLLLFSGMEVTLAEGYDVVVIGEGVPAGAPFLTPLAEVAGWLRDAGPRGMFAFLAHAYRYTRTMDAEMRTVLEVVHGLEVGSVNILRGGWDRPEGPDGPFRPDNARQYLDTAVRFGLVPLSNSDAHSEAAVGTLATVLESDRPVRRLEDLVAALHAGGTAEHQDPALLELFLGATGR